MSGGEPCPSSRYITWSAWQWISSAARQAPYTNTKKSNISVNAEKSFQKAKKRICIVTIVPLTEDSETEFLRDPPSTLLTRMILDACQ